MLKIAILLLTFVTASLTKGDVQKCQKGDTECVAMSYKAYLTDFSHGNEQLGLTSFNPLEVDEIDINSNRSKSVNVRLKFFNSKIYGFEGMNTTKVKGFGEDIKGPHAVYHEAEILNLLGDYSIEGKVLILPISGSGKCNITYLKPKYEIKFKGEPVVKDGKTYLKIVDFKLNLKIKRFISDLDNLFNDQKLSKELNKFLNDNWEDIFKELKDPICRGIEDHIKEIYDKVFEKIPYDELFL